MTSIDLASSGAQEMPWAQGWYGLAKHLPSPNFGKRPAGSSLDLILLHSISLPPGVFGGNAVERLFTNRLDWDEHPYFATIRGLEVSSHFFIGRDGRLTQFVSCDDRAWHAGRSSYLGRENCNDYSIGIELEGLEGGLFEDAQYRTLTPLCVALRKHYGTPLIAGHEHVAPGRKADPGPGFDWSLLQETLGWGDRCFPEHRS
ncbi:MAG: hypothetical protein RLZZ591_25 [Pseudomonadota bacterium]|jgi:AmpD protein